MNPEYPYRYERTEADTLGKYIVFCRRALTDAEIDARLKKAIPKNGRAKRSQELTIYLEE